MCHDHPGILPHLELQWRPNGNEPLLELRTTMRPPPNLRHSQLTGESANLQDYNAAADCETGVYFVVVFVTIAEREFVTGDCNAAAT